MSTEGLTPADAIAKSVRTRVRPIFMSVLTSVGGMLPLVIAPGAGSEMYRGLGSVVVGGLLVSTVFTLAITPLLFSLVLDMRAGVALAFGRRPTAATASASPVANFTGQTTRRVLDDVAARSAAERSPGHNASGGSDDKVVASRDDSINT
jgi:hypothetical protein